jgi:hypothetical protein
MMNRTAPATLPSMPSVRPVSERPIRVSEATPRAAPLVGRWFVVDGIRVHATSQARAELLVRS